jgi:hypothetical protein
MDQVQILVCVILHRLGSEMTGLALQLIVLVDDPIAGLAPRPGGDGEGRDTEVLTDGPPRTAAVVLLVHLVEPRDRVFAHGISPSRSMCQVAECRTGL